MHLATRAAFSILLLATACSRDEKSRPRADTPPEESLSTVTADQLKTRLRALHAKAVLVNAWATWCESCEHELPMLQKMAEKLSPQEVRVMLVSVDEPEERDQVRKFLVDKGIQLPNFLAARPLGNFKAGMNPGWPGMLPASFLFDGTGKLRYFWGGEAFESEIMPIVEGLLAGRPIDGESRFDVAPEGADPAKRK
jgi:thiol-disulfide isomerase/thioredoxin